MPATLSVTIASLGILFSWNTSFRVVYHHRL
jgi:hypothetical protein